MSRPRSRRISRHLARAEQPATKSPLSVGDQVTVTGLLCLTNSLGGTALVDDANMVCVVTKAFWDYETGWRYHGTPVEATDIERLRSLGTSEFTPTWYRENRPDDSQGLAHAETALREFNPAKVYFSEHDVRKKS